MAACSYVSDSFVKQVNDALDSLESGVYFNTFSERGKRQNQEVKQLKDVIRAQENSEIYTDFCKDPLDEISGCVAAPTAPVDLRQEKSYKLFYQKRISHLPKLWNDLHQCLRLVKPDPIWTQTVNRLLFNQALVTAIQQDGKQQTSQLPSTESQSQLGADEENIIRYMAGYIPFKLIKTYKKRKSEEAACVVDCLSAMAQPGPESDFYTYTQEWTRQSIEEVHLRSATLLFYFSPG